MRTLRLFLAIAVAVGSGCEWTSEAIHSCRTEIAETRSAGKAWHSHRWMYDGIPYEGDFKKGFKAGYRFARRGYDCCEPPLPRHYWRMYGWSPEDRGRARAWCDGFSHGTLAAQQDGSVGPSALDAATGQPPVGTPDVVYYPQASIGTGQDFGGEMNGIGPEQTMILGNSPMFFNATVSGAWNSPMGESMMSGRMPGTEVSPYYPGQPAWSAGPSLPPSPAPPAEGLPANAPRSPLPPAASQGNNSISRASAHLNPTPLDGSQPTLVLPRAPETALPGAQLPSDWQVPVIHD